MIGLIFKLIFLLYTKFKKKLKNTYSFLGNSIVSRLIIKLIH